MLMKFILYKFYNMYFNIPTVYGSLYQFHAIFDCIQIQPNLVFHFQTSTIYLFLRSLEYSNYQMFTVTIIIMHNLTYIFHASIELDSFTLWQTSTLES